MRVAVTGISSDFGTVIAPLLFGDPDVEQVVGIDLREPRVAHEKLRFEREDVRSPRLVDLFEGCESVIHLAYVVDEIHDKQLTHSINIGGSKNVIACAQASAVQRLVIASSVASYGAHLDHEIPIGEDQFPRGNHDKYYFYDKAEVEHYIEWWLGQNPDSPMSITRIRPPIILGPAFDKPGVKRLFAASNVLPAELSKVQFLWETDLARAFYMAAKQTQPGPINVGSEDWLDLDQFAALQGQRVRKVPSRVASVFADAMFRLRLLPVSSDWIVAGEPIVSPAKAKRELGWEPRFSSAESARMRAIQLGRPIMPGQSQGVFARKQVAEETLRAMTDRLRSWSRSIPGMRTVIEDGDIDRFADRVVHELLPYRDTSVHLELHECGDADAPTVVFNPGMGAYARFYLPLLGKLCDAGFNVIAIDRPGHGLSEGRRGDATIDQILDVTEAAVRFARERHGGPVVLAGSSLGGIISWYALTREPDVEAVVCHNIAGPAVLPDASARFKLPLVRGLAGISPHAPIPIKQIADFDQVSAAPEILDYVRRELDGIWSWTVSARFAASLFSFVPQRAWSQTTIPTLVMVGERDGMVTGEYTQRVLAAGMPEGCETKIMPGLGHMLAVDHLDEMLPELVGWLRTALSAASPSAVEATIQ